MISNLEMIAVDRITEKEYCLDWIINDINTTTFDEEYNVEELMKEEPSKRAREVINQRDSSLCVPASITVCKSIQDNIDNLNPVFLWNMMCLRHSNEGMSIHRAYHLVYKYGIPTYNTYQNVEPIPSSLLKIDNSITNNVLQDASNHRVKVYGYIMSPETLISVMDLNIKYCNRLFGSFTVLLPIYNNNVHFWKKDLVKTNPHEEFATEKEYHAVSFLDYNKKTKAFTLQNSLGTEWNKNNKEGCSNGCTLFPLNDWYDSVIQVWFSSNSNILCNKFQEYQSKKISTSVQTPKDSQSSIPINPHKPHNNNSMLHGLLNPLSKMSHKLYCTITSTFYPESLRKLDS